jgi:ABC-type multidrug transport system ATPase subunit/ABC-type nitrate/sulfonate/bicarbonate transport system permease component
MDLRIRKLRAGYPVKLFSKQQNVIVDDLSFDVPSSSVVALVGPNGCGKSTILKSIVDPTFRLGGSVLSEERKLDSGQIGYVPQQSVLTLFPWRSGWENAWLWREIHGGKRADRTRDIQNICEEYGLRAPLDQRVADLSGGERVKIALLRSLAVKDMRAWVLDEPFEGLDVRSRELLQRLIRQVADKGIPVLLTSHRREDLTAVDAQECLIEGKPVSTLRRNNRHGHTAAEVVPSFKADPRDGERAPSYEPNKESRSVPLSLIGILAGLFLWGLGAILVNRPSLIPTPWSVGWQMVNLLRSPDLRQPFAATLARALGSWVIGICLALPLGVFFGYHSRLYKLIAPWLSIARAFPIFALVGLAIGLFANWPETQRVFLISFTVFIIFLQVVSAAAFVAPRRRVDLARIYGASEIFRLSRVMIYEAIGGILGGLETTLPLAVIITLVVETFLITNQGIGLYIYNHLAASDLTLVYAYLLWPAIAAATGVSFIRRYARKWRYEI